MTGRAGCIRLLLSIAVGAVCMAAAPYGLKAVPLQAPYLNGHMPELGPGVSGVWKAVVAFPKLTFHNPVGICAIPGTSRLAVWEREGRVWSLANDPNASAKRLVLDLSATCQGWDDSGLLAIAFHPHFAVNH